MSEDWDATPATYLNSDEDEISGTGEITTIEMTDSDKKEARRKQRQKQKRGFGFGRASKDTDAS